MNVYEAINSIKQELGTFSKELEVDDLMSTRVYSVVSFDELTRRVQALETKYGVVTVPRVIEHSSWDADLGAGLTHFAKVLVAYSVVGPDGSIAEPVMAGESESRNSKSMSAAVSFARKSLYKELYQIVVGDPDPDAVGGTVVDVAQARQAAPVAPHQPVAPVAPRQPAPQPVQQQAPQQAAPRPQAGMAERIASTAGTAQGPNGATMSSKKQQQMIWAVSHRELNWDDVQTLSWLSQEMNIDFGGMNLNAATSSLTMEQAKSAITKLKSVAG